MAGTAARWVPAAVSAVEAAADRWELAQSPWGAGRLHVRHAGLGTIRRHAFRRVDNGNPAWIVLRGR